MKQNPIVEKSKAFALRIIGMYRFLTEQKREYVLSKQVLRSGTSIGANIAEASQGQSRADFISKMNIALKEATETEYWLDLLFETDYINAEMYESVVADNRELIKMLISIVKNTKNDK